MEVDEEYDMVILSIYKDLLWNSYYKDNWFKDKWRKIKTCFRLVFIGYIKVDEVFIMRGHQIDDFIDAMINAKQKLDNYERPN